MRKEGEGDSGESTNREVPASDVKSGRRLSVPKLLDGGV
jgi:hypothetical protein